MIAECGIAPRESKTVSGKWRPQTSPTWPWTALLHFSIFGDIEGCMATLIDKEWLITAARCLYVALGPSGSKFAPIPAPHIKVELGAFKRGSSNHQPELHQVSEIVIHKDFDPKKLSGNIALVRLAKPVKFTSKISPICMPTRTEVQSILQPGNAIGVVVGWGKDENHRVKSSLHEAAVSVVHRSHCKWANMSFEVNNMICAGYKEQQDKTCIGDSGSPLMFSVASRGQHPTKWVLGGVMSWGLKEFLHGCHSNYRYTAYTSVGRNLKWIKFKGKSHKGSTK